MHDDSVLSRTFASSQIVTKQVQRMAFYAWKNSPDYNGLRTPFDLYVEAAYTHRGVYPASETLPELPRRSIPFFAYNEGGFHNRDIFQTEDDTLPTSYRSQKWIVLDMTVSTWDDVVPCCDLSGYTAVEKSLSLQLPPIWFVQRNGTVGFQLGFNTYAQKASGLDSARDDRIPASVKVAFSVRHLLVQIWLPRLISKISGQITCSGPKHGTSKRTYFLRAVSLLCKG